MLGKTVCPAGKQNCKPSEEVPLTIQFSAPSGDALTHAAQGQALQWYQPPWEPGNIFSYPAIFQQLQSIYSNLSPLTNGVAFLTDTSTITQKTTWSVSDKTTDTTGLNQNYSWENDSSVSVQIGFEPIASVGGGANIDFSGSNGLSSLTKNTTSLDLSTGLEISKPGTFAPFQTYGYSVAPYVMGTTQPGGAVDRSRSAPISKPSARCAQCLPPIRWRAKREAGGSKPTARPRTYR